MALQEKIRIFETDSDIAARRTRNEYRGEGKRSLPKEECSRVIHGLRCAMTRDRELYLYIESNLEAFYDPLSSVSSAVNWRVGFLEKQASSNAAPVWQAGEYGARMVRRLCHRREHECALAGLALELAYAYLDGLLPVKEWTQVLGLLDRLNQPLVIDGLETMLARRFSIQPDRPILMPSGIGSGTEVFRLDPMLYRHAALLVQDWQRGRIAPRPRRFS